MVSFQIHNGSKIIIKQNLWFGAKIYEFKINIIFSVSNIKMNQR